MNKLLTKKRLKIIFVLFMLVLCANNTVFGEITKTNTGDQNAVVGIVTQVIQRILNTGLNLGTASIATLLSDLALVLFLVLQILFIATELVPNILLVPFPDVVIFNKVPILDANFINPNNLSPLNAMQSTIASVFDSFIVISVAVFTIIAMVIGMKLALSSLAAEKAKYKQAVTGWVTGIILLVTIRWILTGMFLINEEVVQVVYNISHGSEMKFEVFSVASIPLVGSTINNIFSWFGTDASQWGFGEVSGYLGLTLRYLILGLGGNFIGSLVAFVVLGQTISILFTYLKRVIYCLFLGMVAPLIITVDTFNKATGKNSNIFAAWFKQISTTIFMQSFHALFLLVILRLASSLNHQPANAWWTGGQGKFMSDDLKAVIIIILTTGLVKFEKVFKQLFGVSDGFMGDFQASAAKSMATMGMVAKAGRSIADNSKKFKEAKKNKKSLLASRAELESKQKELGGRLGIGGSDGSGDGSGSGSGSGPGSGSGSGDGSGSGTPAAAATAATASGAGASDDTVKGLLRSIRDQMVKERYDRNQEKLRSLDVQLGDNEAKLTSARFASLMSPVTTAAGAAFGLGMNDIAGGAAMTIALDAAMEKIGERGADRSRSRMYDEAKEKGRENPGILREKSTHVVKQTIKEVVTIKSLRDAASIMRGNYDTSGKASAGYKARVYKSDKIDDV